MSSTRLLLEHESICRALVRTDHVWLMRTSLDLLRHDLVYAVRTLVRDADGRVREEEREVGIMFLLHPEHPAVQPLVVAQCDDLFHPHAHDPRHGDPPFAVICMGIYRPTQRLADWVQALWDILRWSRTAPDHPLNPEAAAFARLESGKGRFPTDPREFARPRRPSAGAGVPETPGLRIVSPWRSSS